MTTAGIESTTGVPLVGTGRTTLAPWAIVLAGGEGRRLRALTRHISGDDRPKRFAVLVGGRSLLRQTLDRIRLAIPVERTVVVTHARDAAYLAGEFAAEAKPDCLVQPEDRGTAAAILWAAHTIAAREPGAVAVVFPSDHHIEGEAAFMTHVLDVVTFVRGCPSAAVLVGAVPDGPDPKYGWIEPGAPVGRLRSGVVRRVRRFWEKPEPDQARACHEAGALWNTFVLVARATTLVALGREALPELSARLERLGAFAGTPEETWATRQAFALARHANFSREVLERAPGRLAVSELPAGVRWTDWGTPERVIATLQRLGLRPGWLEALPRHLDLRSDARAVAALRREASNGR
jgi:mannose-1-phosphate guanylyltransferase